MKTQVATLVQHADAKVALAEQPTEYLTLQLGEEHYGIDIQCVQEIRGYEAPTHIAGSPESMRGVLDLRGVIVPVIDLRLLLGMPAKFNSSTVTVVLNLPGRTVGVVVDSVVDVLNLTPEQIMAVPAFNASFSAKHITGFGKIGAGPSAMTLILLDIKGLISSMPEIMH